VRRILRAADSILDAVARRRAVAILACVLLSLAGSMLVSFVVKRPAPLEHDEFSYLLAADTFAHGRLANPPHPMWRHFETFHVIQQPTYASKYPPAQGLALAAGQALFGHAIAGVWLTGALLCGAICWMLFAYAPARWALIGGLIAVARFGVSSSWTQSYWGGAVAGLGGALVFGALPRLGTRATVRDAVWLACGAGILANSRPFEGLVAMIPVVVLAAAWVVRRARAGEWRAVARVGAPVLLVLAGAAAWTAAYDRAVTGSPWRLPYWVYEESYPVAPAFLWIDAPPISDVRHEAIRVWCERYQASHAAQRTLSGFLDILPKKGLLLWRFFAGWWLSLPLVLAWLAWRRRWMGTAAVALLLVLAALVSETIMMPHYLAPVVSLLVMVMVTGLRVLASFRPAGWPAGKAAAYALVLAALLPQLDQLRALRRPAHPEWQRARVEKDLVAEGGRHLVLVRYGPDHLATALGFDWVYNGADPDAAPVVWARDLGDAGNGGILEHYRDRKVSRADVGFTRGSVRIERIRN
jgi:hypothetical protein